MFATKNSEFQKTLVVHSDRSDDYSYAHLFSVELLSRDTVLLAPLTRNSAMFDVSIMISMLVSVSIVKMMEVNVER